jgi:hypothetical protein
VRRPFSAKPSETTRRTSVSAPGPAPARELRSRLAAARADCAGFDDVWSEAIGLVVSDMERDERRSWARAFTSTCPAWRRGYDRQAVARTPLAGPTNW